MLSELDKRIIRELQEGLPLVSRPYQALADRLNLGEDELLARIKDFIDRGVIRRFGAAVRHQDLGFVANAMVVWPVPEERLEEVGTLLAGFDKVSHCYARPAHPPGWPYNLFTMIHGQTEQECRRIAARLAAACGVENYRLLFSSAELKKSSMKYFLGE
ncbi:AsnC family transcriptional regulator [Desulfotomaculum copahuensis]|uniref:siroheme decarboxylase n=1 Tax=Desulfotomaculum copahuensis TaxID=1838280 RepID=A0A1B7LH59_9FIRM|nr:AsnC family transcriptional regulator [Desulfotomaculum copahuensis]OAT85522.1 transcriptional regulator [Desulfotomaculum copahuensis]